MKCKHCRKELLITPRGVVHKEKVWGNSMYGHPDYNDGKYCTEERLHTATPERHQRGGIV